MGSEVSPSVLVIGEALMDLVIHSGHDLKDAEAVPGGSPANVALALGRLGLSVDLVTWIGLDQFGHQIREHLEDSHVRIDGASAGAARTSTAEAYLDEQGAASYIFKLEWAPRAPIAVPETALVAHTGSIGSVIQPGSTAVLDAFKRARETALTTYDPNARPSLMGSREEARATIEAFVAQSDVVKVSDEDLEWLFPQQDPLDSAKQWMERFSPALLVVTRGGEGPVAWTSQGAKAELMPESVSVVDTVGAGDTFMGGLIDALWRRDLVGRDAAQAVRDLSDEQLLSILSDASELASIVVQRRGANPPWAVELGR